MNDHGIQWRTLLDLKRAQLHGGEGLMRRQQDRFEALLSHARARSRFYQRHYAGLSSSDLALGDLPAVTKPRLMAAFDDWVTDPIITRAGLEAFIAQPNQIGVPYLDRYFVCTSSGTTGHPGLFVHDSRAVGVYQAINTARITPAWFDAGQLMRIARGGFRWAAVLGTQSHYVGASWLALEQRRGGWRSRGIQVFSVQQKLEALVAELQAFDPVLLTGYPSAIDLLAQEQLAGRLKLKLVTVELSGESLPQEAHARIAAAFGCPVRDLYAASECPSIAFSCDHGWLHVNSDWVVLEPVEEDLGPTPVGRFSHTVLLTNLANWIQPLIRYDLGDSVMVSPDRCACGCPLPAIRVAGRQDDILQLAGANGSVVKVPPLAIGAVIEESPGVKLGQILQVGPSTIHLRLELIDGVDAGQVWRDAIARLEAYLSTQRLDNVTVVRSGEPPKRSAPFGKFRQVIAGRAMNDGSAPTPGA